tara:strand:- start:854 stop:1525 length:672 start_codon:yes stop_codon:yes gene_type:complete
MVTPSIFNSFAQLAQLKIFNKMFDSLIQGKNFRLKFLDPAGEKSTINQIKEDLSNFLKTQNITKASDQFNKPDDISRLISICGEASDTSSNVNIDSSSEIPIEVVYDRDKLRRILRSPVIAPNASHPIAFFGEEIVVYPSSVTDIKLTYYKIPQGRNTSDVRVAQVPNLSFVSTTGVADVNASINFELPEHYTEDLVFEIGSMIGLNLRDADVVNYSELKEKE